MLNKSFLLHALLVGGAVLFMVDCLNSVAPSSKNAQASFVPLPLALSASVGEETDARQLLKKAIENLSWKRTNWLKTKIRQSMANGVSTFAADGYLLRGPNHCARFEMSVLPHGTAYPSRLLVVSDGQTVAQVRGIGNNSKVVCEPLPAISDSKPDSDAQAREAYLVGKGCGGPLILLQDVQARLDTITMQTGLLRGRPMIRVQGEITQKKNPAPAVAAVSVRICCLYLDPKTLWPHRLEWWDLEKSGQVQAVLQFEFYDPSVNQELSPEECARAFSYQPNQAKSD